MIGDVCARRVCKCDTEVLRVLDLRAHLRDRLLGVGGESLQDRLDEAGVVELLMADLARHPRSDQQRGDAHPVRREPGAVVDVQRRWGDVVVEPAMLVVDDDEQARLMPDCCAVLRRSRGRVIGRRARRTVDARRWRRSRGL